MGQSQGSDVELVDESELADGSELVPRRFRSPLRVLARSFRMSRDNWREKHHAVQAKLEQERQHSAERGQSRDRWRSDYEAAAAQARAAESLAQQRLAELEQARARIAQLEVELKKSGPGTAVLRT